MRRACIILLIAGIAGIAVAGPSLAQFRSESLMGEVTDVPADFIYYWWAGVGNVTDFTVANFLECGQLGRHADDEHPYGGMVPAMSLENWQTLRGRTGEYPAESKQFYIFDSGFWFGALVPPDDTAGVSKGAYSSDMGAMSTPEMVSAGSMGDISSRGLYFSNMVIPPNYGYDGEGNKLFAWPGETPESYQTIWPFADTILNDKRGPDEQLDPDAGDVVSHEDTYAVGGDWIDAELAMMMWIHRYVTPEGDTVDAPYDGGGLGIRIEQQTYSWNNGELANAIVLNYKIWNMNDYTLEAPYFSYFMDNDIGNSDDDETGYDASRGLGYTFDSDGSETGWSSPAGYVGCLFLETPGDVGPTGFESWVNGSEQDDATGSVSDPLKYDLMMSTAFLSDGPDDVRQLLNSGPYPDMAPDGYYDYTLAIVFGETLADIQGTADSVVAAFEAGLPWFDPVGITDDPSGNIESARLELTSSNITDGLVTFQYSVPSTTNIDLSVFDAAGRRIEVLAEGSTTGLSTLTWPVTHLPAGVYFIKLTTENESLSKRVIVFK